MVERGLGNGARAAVIGGGIAGWATAIALLNSGRLRARQLSVTVFEGPSGKAGTPVVLTPECRSRLASLGCRAPMEWRGLELRGLAIYGGSDSVFIPFTPGSLWVVDQSPDGPSGRELILGALQDEAERLGAVRQPGRVDRVELDEGPPNRRGELIVRSRGRGDRFDAAVLACGASDPLAAHFLDRSRRPPTLPAAYARLVHPTFRMGEVVARLLLAPAPGVDALLLLPCQRSTFAFGFGERLATEDFCQVVMNAARDGHFPEAFELSDLTLTQVPRGSASALCGPRRVVVGTAAAGHPLQLGLTELLVGAGRAGAALVEYGGHFRALRSRYRLILRDLTDEAAAVTRALGWLRTAGPAAISAFVPPRAPPLFPAPPLLGIPGLSGLGLLRGARVTALRQTLRRWLTWQNPPSVPTLPFFEPHLFYVVDDDGDSREALSELLRLRGATVIAFADELALFAAVAHRPPTAVLLDVVLRWIDGLRLCRGLKEHPSTASTPVYLMSALDRPHIRQRAREAGAAGFFPKPLDPDALWRALGAERDPAAPPSYEISA